MAGFADLVALADEAVRDNLTDPAFWRVGGAAVTDGQPTVPIQLETPDEVVDYGQGGRAIVPTAIIRVFKVDVAAPAKGDVAQLQAGGRTFKIIARPQIDAEGTEWRCEATEAAP